MSSMYSPRLLEEILSKINIVDLVSEYVAVKKSGKSFKARCPFHEERTPSFNVSPDKQIFHCFGCGKGGDGFRFVMEMEHLAFPEAVEHLAKKAGVVLTSSFRENADSTGRTAILEANRLAAERYHALLLGPEGANGMAYLRGRGFDEAIIKKHTLGYAPGDGNTLTRPVLQGTTADDLVTAGLVNRETGRDVFRNRILFPIHDASGRVLGFGGRAIEETQIPKYLNTAENAVFHKSSVLFGIRTARDAIRKQEFAIIVEGYFDVLRLQGNSIENVVAPLGTALTDLHVRFLGRFTDRVLLFFDSDDAGRKAALRSIETVLKHGVDLKIAALPAGFDPDSFVAEYGSEALVKFLNQAQNFLDYALAWSVHANDTATPAGKSRLAREMLALISLLPDAIERAEYTRLLAEKLSIREELLLTYLVPSRKEETGPVEEANGEETEPDKPAENLLLSILIADPSCWEKARLLKGCLTPRMEKVFACARNLSDDNVPLTPVALICTLQDSDAETARWLSTVAIEAETTVAPHQREQVLKDCLTHIHRVAVTDKIKETTLRMKEKQSQNVPYEDELKTIQELLASKRKG